LTQIKGADFIAWDAAFFSFLGTNARIERFISFPDIQHVHESPVYVPESNELLFSDTSAVGWLWAINVELYEAHNKPLLINLATNK
jgi:gluconolactonase